MDAGSASHVSVLLPECVEALRLQSGDFAVDCTFGRGGHSRALLSQLGRNGRLLAIDKDPVAIASAEAAALGGTGQFEIRHGSFTGLSREVEGLGWTGQVAGVLMDLGVSSPQLDEGERGFSFLRDGPLDMRMDPTTGETAAEWLGRVPEAELAGVLWKWGEERFSRRIAAAVVEKRQEAPLETTRELAKLIEAAVPTREIGKHPATRSFQAIRIAVNRELEDLEQGLIQAIDVLKPGGRVAVISFHSLEDRIVKRFLRDQERGWSQGYAPHPMATPPPSRLKRIGKAVMPGAEEILANPRARSAVLRVAEKI
jgi:16S rRNA (cytosine1402-N4)-methyltransferase